MTHREQRSPASPAQQGIWIGARRGAGPAYHMPLALWFDGDLDVSALLSACAGVVARHPVLATTVVQDGDGLHLAEAAEPPVTVVELPDPSPAALDRLIAEETARAFDLEKGPPARFVLAPAGPRRHLLLFVAHHLVFDGMSKDILVRDLARYYAEATAPRHPLSFADAARDEQDRVSAALPAARAFWSERWSEPADLALPGQRRTASRYGPGEQIGGGADDELRRRAAEVARTAGATVFETLVAAVQALLFRYGADNPAVMIDVTTRGPAARDHIGPFVNELPVTARPEPGQSFDAFVREVRAGLRELYAHREVPLTRALGHASRAAVAPVSISYRRRDAEPEFPGLAVSADWTMFGGGVRNALHLQFVDGPDGLATCLRFDPAALDRGAAERFRDGLRALLGHAAADPEVRLADLEVVSPAERSRLVTEWNATAADYGAATLHDLFAEQVRARPGAVAVTFGDRSLTFAGLEAAAGRIARRLRRAGVRRGDLVAVCLPRSDTLPAALLAVHKAGAAYLPLDPDHPAERLAMIVEDARPRLVLSDTAVPCALPGPVLLVDDEEQDADPAGGDEQTPPSPGELAYVIYTSGSTGRPKGVEVEHGNLANLLLSMRDRLGSGPGDRWLALTSPAFDISALELYLPLVTGGTVVVAAPGAVRRPEALARLVAEQGVTYVQATPSVWRLLLPGGISGATALTGGEALPPRLAGELRARFGRVFNVYGPTETTIWSTLGEPGRAGQPPAAGTGEPGTAVGSREVGGSLEAERSREAEVVTIGRPIANTQVYLLDETLRPVPTGVAGELCIGGAGVARGYRGRPGRTAERFVPDPFGPPGSRLYRTGDLARHRPDGEIEFLGRQDGQVKLLGHRIELGEIEARLLDHPQVAEAVVLLTGTDARTDVATDAGTSKGADAGASSDASTGRGTGAGSSAGTHAGEARLVAYVVPVAGASPEPGALTAHLSRTLPRPMLPAAYVMLDALPLNPVGKLDRAALPEPAATSDDVHRGTPSEAGLAVLGEDGDAGLVEEVRRIWREVLELDDIGDEDDLFDLGGHSITITQITARIRERLGVEMSLDAFFDDPTVIGVAEEIASLREEAGGPQEEAPEPAGVRPRPAGVQPPMSPAQQRLWFLQRFDPEDASYNMYLVLRMRGALDAGALDAALDAVVARHESLRTSFSDGGADGEPVTVVHPPGPVPVERLDLTSFADAEDRARSLVAARTNAPFDLAGSPPLRVSLLALGPDDHVLCFVLHHIITDGWSLGIMLDDLFALYQARAEGREPRLAALPVQYGDIALWQREQEAGPAADEALEYWRRKLAAPPALELPTDLPRGRRPEGAFHPFPIPEQVVARLERLAQEHGASLFMVLAAAYQVLLARHSGQDDILVGTPWAVRDRVEFEPVVGYLTDTLVLRGDLAGDPAFADLLDATRRTVLEAHAHRTVPFERLVGELGVPRDVHHNPLLSTMIILHSQAGDGAPPERVGDLRVELFDGGYRQAKFDLALETWRQGEGLLAVLGYDATLFQAATVEALAERFATLLRGIADAPATPISRLPMLTPTDETLLAASRTGGDELSDVPTTRTAPTAQVSREAAAGRTTDDSPDGTSDGTATTVEATAAVETGATVETTSAVRSTSAVEATAVETVPALFARMAAATPDATALLCGDQQVGYGELDARTARLAAALRRRGVVPGAVVGVCLGRSVEALVALLAVWRAGAAYLPLDPEYPDERLAFLVGDSGARLVVTAEALAHRLPPGTPLLTAPSEPDTGGDTRRTTRLCDDTRPAAEPGDPTRRTTEPGGDTRLTAEPGDPTRSAAESGDDAWRAVEPGDPAYVIYTSGSTGRPKGVLVEHGALAGRVRWMREAYDLGPGDRVVQFASLSFDAHAEELYPALTAGASVLLLPDGAATLPDVLRTPAGRDVTVLDLPTAYWHRLTEALDDLTWPERLRLVIIGGEQAHAAAVARWRDRFGDRVRLVNTYGPTEATVIATAAALGAADAGRRPSIGRPIAGATAHVLGPHGEPVPPGVPGELYLGGAGLARGYLGRPALTADRFVPDPYGPPGSRLYRTGDRARWRPDGTLEFLGRFDGQAKVRGFRVEPGEVEAALLADPLVRQAAVVADGDRLVAYVTGTADPDDLRRLLSATLPPHLVPTAWVAMDALPLTVTGKVDLAALPAPAPAPAVAFVAPRTDAEVLVAGVWAEVLGLEVVGAFDDFFALGGHSLLVIRVAALLRDAVDLEVPIRTVFDRPTVAGLAEAVENLLVEQLSGLSEAEAARLLDTEVLH
ncbi:amino acid adenylation domain-containing protein [Sphaerisporangium sp. NPDC005289]|uniref:amino acid adenylation domain-containing protein n=1 Tax=Sphaerisporangium sp. NPDC005289 TaxID=3155247 RepID=UPI0033A6D598